MNVTFQDEFEVMDYHLRLAIELAILAILIIVRFLL
jgi:hypothetical protein